MFPSSLRRALSAAILATAVASSLSAQTAVPRQNPSGLIDVSHNWGTSEGDNPAWASPAFDSSAWETVDLDDMDAAEAGWHWYRLSLQLAPGHSGMALLLEGGDGTYEVYVNGVRLPGATLHSAFNVARPTERAFALHDAAGTLVIALRTHAPGNYIDYKLPLFLSATVGSPEAIEYKRAALQAARLDNVWPSIAINLLLCIAGLGVLCLYLGQRSHRDYLYLGLYLFVLGLSNGLWNLQQAGVAPTSFNLLVSDPLIYVYTILQIEFTFSFVGKRPNLALRIYQAVLLLPWILAGLCWTNRLPSDIYAFLEPALIMPAAVLLTVLLLVWYRRGNREAGWLILPSLLPLTADALFDLGFASIVLGWERFNFLDSLIPIGLVGLQIPDLANLLFLIAIGIVLYFRFTRVSREQARTEAELEAAREVQQRLVPSILPTLRSLHIEAAYFPANEVGGDFYQVFPEPNDGTLIVIGDVSGKGLKAAMTGALAIGALRTLAAEGLPPAALLGRLNQQIFAAQSGGFITCLCLRIAPGGEATLANAGHLAPYCNGKEISVDFGLPLGMIADAEYPERTLQLSSGETLTLLSDGVVEARTKSGELFGFDRTAAISRESAQNIAQAAQHYGQEDDITVLTLTVRSAPEALPGTVPAPAPAPA
jgi:serine phosphatase RsbU (regulator of sigma subunit)